MKRFGVIYLEQPGVQAAAHAWTEVDGYIAWDREADNTGAPQNVAELHSLISLAKPVWYRGGMETVHTAELILGLGCEKVVVGKGFFKTERTPEHFARRLGEACVVAVETEDQLEVAWSAGAEWIYRQANDCVEILRGGRAAQPWGVALLPD